MKPEQPYDPRDFRQFLELVLGRAKMAQPLSQISQDLKGFVPGQLADRSPSTWYFLDSDVLPTKPQTNGTQMATKKPTAATLIAELQKQIATYADAELAKLTPAQLAAVKALAGDDKGRALETIEALRPTWASAPVVDAAPQAPAPAAPPAPAETAPGRTAPPSPAPQSSIDPAAEYARLKTINPFAAAQYLSANYGAIQGAAASTK